eukprot:362044-Chlamydomonas_euryale.AAC.2
MRGAGQQAGSGTVRRRGMREQRLVVADALAASKPSSVQIRKCFKQRCRIISRSSATYPPTLQQLSLHQGTLKVSQKYPALWVLWVHLLVPNPRPPSALASRAQIGAGAMRRPGP